MKSITGEEINVACYYYVIKYNGVKKAFYKKTDALEYYEEFGKQLTAQEKDELFPRQWVIMERDISQIPLVQERQKMII